MGAVSASTRLGLPESIHMNDSRGDMVVSTPPLCPVVGRYHLQVHGPMRDKFQAFISPTPQAAGFSRAEWLAAVAVTRSGKLAELIKLAMTSTWSDWSNGGQGPGDCTPIIQTRAGRRGLVGVQR